MKAKKKIKAYITKSVRKIKNRKGYGVHSPFAFSIITEVIEEKCAYYAYPSMRPVYQKDSPIPFKVACLLFRLANRFECRNILELSCDGGFTLLPLKLVDSRNQLYSLGDESSAKLVKSHFPENCGENGNVHPILSLDELPVDFKADMVVINGIPKDMDEEVLFQWIMDHATDKSVFFIKGIEPDHIHETLWDCFCDSDDVSITMDMYDYGLAILRPYFFKQHYVVAF